jgi:hypothetical protein
MIEESPDRACPVPWKGYAASGGMWASLTSTIAAEDA